MDSTYTIGQLSELSGLSPHTLRYYEKEGLLGEVGRGAGGYRMYEERDLAWVQLLQQLRRTGMPIGTLRRLAEWRSEGAATLADRRRLLEGHRDEVLAQLAELQDRLEQLDRKVELYAALEEREPAGAAGGAAMQAYYASRAAHYERIYHRDDRVRRSEQLALEQAMRAALADKRVLELACGTGYWTERLAGAAARILATDTAPETLELARHKPLPPGKVDFRLADAYAPESVPGSFDAALAMFWYSHIPRARLTGFLQTLQARLEPGAVVFLADNVYVPGVGGELVHREGEPDTYKRRELADGTRHEVLKNYYAPEELEEQLRPFASGLTVHHGVCFWWASFRLLETAGSPDGHEEARA